MLADVYKVFCFQKFVDNSQQCVAFTPQANFPANNFHWRWRWWDQIQAIFLNLFYFSFCYYGLPLRSRRPRLAFLPLGGFLYGFSTSTRNWDHSGSAERSRPYKRWEIKKIFCFLKMNSFWIFKILFGNNICYKEKSTLKLQIWYKIQQRKKCSSFKFEPQFRFNM